MAGKRTFTSVVLAAGAVPALGLCVLNGFLPSLRDVSDPLGRPSVLSEQVIDSAQQLDTVTAKMEPKHALLAVDIQVLGPLSGELGVLAGRSVELSPLAALLTGDAEKVGRIAGPLPDVVAGVTGRATEADSTMAGVSTSIGSVTTELQGIHGGLGTIRGTLQALGPKTSGIAATLAVIAEQAAHVQVFGPLLAVIGPPVNSLGIPPLGFEAPPLPPLPHS
ncbi:hypothetical protein [Nocardia rhizosphaerihabitans]|uniref:Uncharacterized protein n=1 Tax=Nocardia rhizosphaerihabitans TaxID=1691570 RepID=A0ABQ2L307_9NOCA|nr:hypothetical protein [Nocardia rhizosphaerihabitans]GGO00737.1 hypothetical protein GCM10011610_70020 [Nocardia rhizosphaerihabitans]